MIDKMNVSFACAACTILAAFAATTPQAMGQGVIRTWHVPNLGSPNGEFSDFFRWRDESNNPGVPGFADVARFNFGGMYSVDFTQDQLTDRLQVRGGYVTFRLSPPAHAGASYEYMLSNPMTASPSIVVGMSVNDTAGLNVIGGALRGVFTDVGLDSGSFGMLQVSGQDASLHNQLQLRVGNKGAGLFDLLDGAQAHNDIASIGTGNGSFGQATIEGSGTHWSCSGNLTIGKGGYGAMRISDQALVTSGNAIIAQQLSSFGDVEVAGAGSAWEIAGTLDVGMHGSGELRIRNGAAVSNLTFATLGLNPTGPQDTELQGRAVIDGIDSLWSVNGNIYVGLFANGSLTLARGGRIEVSGNLYEGTVSAGGSQLRIELGSSTDYSMSPAVHLGGESQWNGDVHVAFVDGFTPALGDVYRILTAELGGNFTYNLPALPEPLQWQVMADGINSDLQIIEPAIGDLNGDGVVDVSDLLILMGAWGPCPGKACPADLNGDGFVDISDLLILFSNWG